MSIELNITCGRCGIKQRLDVSEIKKNGAVPTGWLHRGIEVQEWTTDYFSLCSECHREYRKKEEQLLINFINNKQYEQQNGQNNKTS